jgi:glyoxylase-like metal-dependent hydrolase (beta-lactamase superfamily II)
MKLPLLNRIGPVPVALSMLIALSAATSAESALLNEPPAIRPETLRQIASGVSIIPDPRINYVPNIGIVEGQEGILVIDTGMGPMNGRLLYEKVRDIARGRRIYVTSTHFHPEHSYGASAFPSASFIQNSAQVEEVAEKGEVFADLFRSFGENEKQALEGVRFVRAGISYSGRIWLDLGQRKVLLQEAPAHTRGDQIVFVPESGVLFTGDLVEDRFFPIMPDEDSRGSAWIAVMQSLLELGPRIVVPGHGSIGDPAMIRAVSDYLSHVRAEVFRLADAGNSQEEIAKVLVPRMVALHPDWDNAIFVPNQIAIFYAERRNQRPKLPKLEINTQAGGP